MPQMNGLVKDMKCKLLSGFLGLGVACAASGQADAFYINDGVILCPPGIPPVVNATNFVNSNYFNINFTNPFVINPQLYETSSTLNYTNVGKMVANRGFRFETKPSGAGIRRMAANFHNAGTISAGSVVDNTNTAFNLFFGIGAAGLPKLLISATNVVQSGTNIIGRDGLYNVNGKRVDLTRGNITMEGFDVPSTSFSPIDGLPQCIASEPVFVVRGLSVYTGFTNDAGIFDSYWSLFGGGQIDAAVNFGTQPVRTPPYTINRAGGIFDTKTMQLPGAVSYVDETFLTTNSRIVRVVFLSNTNAGIIPNVYFRPFSSFLNFANGHTVVEWVAPTTNAANGTVFTNHLYFFDNFNLGFTWPTTSDPQFPFFRFCTNFFATNGVLLNASELSLQPTFKPANYTFFNRRLSQASLLGPPAAPGTFSFNSLPVFVASTSYGARFSPTTQLRENIQGGLLTNMPGRIEVTADAQLDLSFARIAGLNYLGLKATNHFLGSTRAAVSVPWSDINLASTNGRLNITNILAPTVPRFSGDVEIYSAAWSDFSTNFVTGGTLESEYHVLFVDARLSPVAPALIQDLTLRSTNTAAAGGEDSLIVSDVYNVTRKLLLDSKRITITSNPPPALTRVGEINLLGSAITWPGSTPRLAYLTNHGIIRAQNAVFFGGSRTAPFYNGSTNEPYAAFVNRGGITNEGTLIWASYFENSGAFSTATGFGSIALGSQNTLMTNGGFFAGAGAISIHTGDLVISNHSLHTSGPLTVSATNLITDGYPLRNQFGEIVTTNTPVNGGITNGNLWLASSFNLLSRPVTGDLLATTVSNSAPTHQEVVNVWAGEDRGCTADGFVNNAALGRLILDGGTDSKFTFVGAGASNAIYVDFLDLRGSAVVRDEGGNFVNLSNAPNMRIYYAQAVASGASIAEKLNGANGGSFCWVSNYAGAYSSTDVVYPDGNIYRLNAALIESCTINSDPDLDDIVNCADTTPVFVGSSLDLNVVMAGAPLPKANISWNSVAFSTNYLYVRNLTGVTTNWQVLTNFVLGPSGGRVTVVDPAASTGGRFYRVRVDKH